jgi:hypothetical protein
MVILVLGVVLLIPAVNNDGGRHRLPTLPARDGGLLLPTLSNSMLGGGCGSGVVGAISRIEFYGCNKRVTVGDE